MRKMMLVVGAGLFAITTLPNTDSIAAETVVKKNFNLPKLVPPPATGGPVGDLYGNLPADVKVYLEPGEPVLSPKLTVKKNFNLPKLVPALEYFLPHSSEGEDWYPHDYYQHRILFPYAHEEGHDHDDSTARDNSRAGNDQRHPPRP